MIYIAFVFNNQQLQQSLFLSDHIEPVALYILRFKHSLIVAAWKNKAENHVLTQA